MGFTNEELRSVIQKELNNQSLIPEGHKGAFVLHVDESGARTTLATKVGDHWEVDNYVGWHPHSEGLEWGTNVMASW